MPPLRPDTPVKFLKGIGERRAEAIARLGVRTAWDLLNHLPHRYLDASTVTPVAPATLADITIVPEVTTFGDGAGGALTQTLISAQTTATEGLFAVALPPVFVTVPPDAIAATYEGNATLDVVSGP